MTALPVKPLIPPEQVFLFIQEIRQRLSPISLDSAEYYDTIQNAAEGGVAKPALTDTTEGQSSTETPPSSTSHESPVTNH